MVLHNSTYREKESERETIYKALPIVLDGNVNAKERERKSERRKKKHAQNVNVPMKFRQY